MLQEDFVSVIISTFNRQNTIKKSIESVIAQSYSNIEIIVIDDGSTDKTKEIISTISDSRLHYLYQNHLGSCVAKNTGLSIAKGNIIAFQDSDDIWHNNKLEIQIAALKDNDADVCFCSLCKYYPNKSLTKVFPNYYKPGFVDREVLMNRGIVSTQCIVAKKTAFEHELFDPKVIKWQEWDWIIRSSLSKKFFFIKDVLVDQYLQSDSITIHHAKDTAENFIYLHNKYIEDYNTSEKMHYLLLLNAARDFSLVGIDASKYYYKAFKFDHSFKTIVKAFLSKMHILQYLLRLKKLD